MTEQKNLKRLGIIGAGNMATAIVMGICEAFPIIISDAVPTKLEAFSKMSTPFGTPITTCKNVQVCEESDSILLAVKPNCIPSVLEEIKDYVADKLIISIAAGVKLETMATILGPVPIIRVMPNTPCFVGEGMSAICRNSLATDEHMQYALDIFNKSGKTVVIEQQLMDVAVSVCGSGPMLFFMMVDAMANAAVMGGMDKKTALNMATQTMLGSAKLLMETQEHPRQLMDKVCSPKGTTICGVNALEQKGFAGIIMKTLGCMQEASKNIS